MCVCVFVCVCVCVCVHVCVCVYVCVCVVVIVHWHCSAQLSMFSMEKRYRNNIIIIIIIINLFCWLKSLPDEGGKETTVPRDNP